MLVGRYIIQKIKQAKLTIKTFYFDLEILRALYKLYDNNCIVVIK